MGDVLVRYGVISQADLERALVIVRSDRKRLGAVLAELGLLDQDGVAEAIGLHAREILFNAISRPGVSCMFEEAAESALENDGACRSSTGQLILEATRRVHDPEMVRTVLGDLGRVLLLSADPMLRTQKITLTPADGFVLSRVDGRLSARDVMALVPLPSDDVERSLFSLLCTGIVGYPEDTAPTRRTARTAARPASEPAPAVARGATPAPELVPLTPPPGVESRRIDERSAEQVRALILKLHERLKLDHFEVLGLERSASETEVREAFTGFARILHPDAVLDPALADLSEKREAVFIRLSAAHETLRNPASRASYERAFEPSKLRSARPAPARPEPPSPPPSPSPAPVPVPAAIPRVPAREPERPTFDERLTPEGILATAEGLYKDAAYWEAIQQLEPMIRRATGATRARARLLLAQAYLKNPKWTRRAEAVLQDLLAEDPRHVAAHLRLAEIYRATGLASRARSAFEKVLELEPGHFQAREALEALQPKGHDPASGLATLFRRR